MAIPIKASPQARFSPARREDKLLRETDGPVVVEGQLEAGGEKSILPLGVLDYIGQGLVVASQPERRSSNRTRQADTDKVGSNAKRRRFSTCLYCGKHEAVYDRAPSMRLSCRSGRFMYRDVSSSTPGYRQC